MNDKKMCDCNQGRQPCTCKGEAVNGLLASPTNQQNDDQLDVPTSVAQFMAIERPNLLKTIDEQAREIERLKCLVGKEQGGEYQPPQGVIGYIRKTELERFMSDGASFSTVGLDHPSCWEEEPPYDHLTPLFAAMKAQPSGVVPAALIEALKYYANGDHLLLADPDAWETCSGEPMNFLHDAAGTASVEDGSIAKAALESLNSSPGSAAQTADKTSETHAALGFDGAAKVSDGGVDERDQLAAEAAYYRSTLRNVLKDIRDDLVRGGLAESWRGVAETISVVLSNDLAALTAPAPNHSEQVLLSDLAFLAEYILGREYGRALPNYEALGRFPIDVAEQYAAAPSAGSQGGDV